MNRKMYISHISVYMDVKSFFKALAFPYFGGKFSVSDSEYAMIGE